MHDDAAFIKDTNFAMIVATLTTTIIFFNNKLLGYWDLGGRGRVHHFSRGALRVRNWLLLQFQPR